MFDDKTNELKAVRELIAAMEAKHDALILPFKEQEKAIEIELIAEMKKAGTTIVRSTEYSATINRQELPRIVDSTKFERYLLRHKALHLFERRVSRKAFGEWMETHKVKDLKAIGVEVFTKESIGLHKLGSTKT